MPIRFRHRVAPSLPPLPLINQRLQFGINSEARTFFRVADHPQAATASTFLRRLPSTCGLSAQRQHGVNRSRTLRRRALGLVDPLAQQWARVYPMLEQSLDELVVAG